MLSILMLSGRCILDHYHTTWDAAKDDDVIEALAPSFPQKRAEAMDTDKELSEVEYEREKLFNSISRRKIDRKKDLCVAEYHQSSREIVLTRITGKKKEHIGKPKPDGSNVWVLQPEEAYYLVDCGALILYANGCPLSCQQTLRLCLSLKMDWESYLVYAHLTRDGYAVVRHSPRVPSTTSPESPKSPVAKRAKSSTNISDDNLVLSPKPSSSTDATYHCVQHQDESAVQSSNQNSFFSDKCSSNFKTERTEVSKQRLEIMPMEADIVESRSRQNSRSSRSGDAVQNVPSKGDGHRIETVPQGPSSAQAKKAKIMASIPDSGGGPVTLMVPAPSEALFCPINRQSERLMVDSREFERRQGAKQKRKEDIYRPRNWEYVPRFLLGQSRDWTDYKRLYDLWKSGMTTDELWRISGLRDRMLSEKTQSNGAAKGQTWYGDFMCTLKFDFDVYLPNSGYSVSMEGLMTPEQRVIVSRSKTLPCARQISALKKEYDTIVPIVVAAVDNGAISFFTVD